MLKPNSLRARLTEAFPDEFARDTTRLQLWIEQGHVRCHAGEDNLNYSIEYSLSVSLTGWRRSSLEIWIVLLDWLRIQQPDLLTPAKSPTAIPFEVDIVAADEADIGFDLALTEAVRVTRRPDGGFDMQVVAEPDPLFPETRPLLEPGSLLKQIWAHGRQLVPDDPENS